MFTRNVLFFTVLRAVQSPIIFYIDNILCHSKYIKFSRTQKQPDFPHLLIKKLEETLYFNRAFSSSPKLTHEGTHTFPIARMHPKHNRETSFLQ